MKNLNKFTSNTSDLKKHNNHNNLFSNTCFEKLSKIIKICKV